MTPQLANLYPGQDTTGLCPVDTFERQPLYREGMLPDDAEIERRKTAYWKPYHEALQAELQRLVEEDQQNTAARKKAEKELAEGEARIRNKRMRLNLVRTDSGRELVAGMLADGVIVTRPGDDDPGAIALLRKLSLVSRRRWPETAVPEPRLGVPPLKSKA